MRTHSHDIVISIIVEIFGEVATMRKLFFALHATGIVGLVAGIKQGHIQRTSSSASSSSALMAELDIFGEVATMREGIFALYATVTVGWLPA